MESALHRPSTAEPALHLAAQYLCGSSRELQFEFDEKSATSNLGLAAVEGIDGDRTQKQSIYNRTGVRNSETDQAKTAQAMFLFKRAESSEGTSDPLDTGVPLDTSRHHIRKDLVVNSSRRSSTTRSQRKLLSHAKRGLLSKYSRRRLSESLSDSGNKEDLLLLRDLANKWEDKLDDANERLESDTHRASIVRSNSNGDDPMAELSVGTAYVNQNEVDIANNARRGTMDKCARDKMFAYRMAGNSDRKIAAKGERDMSEITTDELRREHRHTNIASSSDSRRTRSDGLFSAQVRLGMFSACLFLRSLIYTTSSNILQGQIERGGFDGPVRIMDDGRLVLDHSTSATSVAVVHRDSSNTPSYPKYSGTVSNIQSEDSNENVKLIQAAAMGLVSRNTLSSRGLEAAVQQVINNDAIRRSLREEDGDTPSESDSENASQDSSNNSGSTLGVQNISNRSLLSVATEIPRRSSPIEGHSSPSKRSTSRPKARSELRSNVAGGEDDSTFPKRPESSEQAPDSSSSFPAGRPLGASARHFSTGNMTSNPRLRSAGRGRIDASRASKRPGRGNRSRASFLKDRRLSTINNASRGLMSEESRRRMLEGFSIGSAGVDGESVTDSSDSEDVDRAAPQVDADAPGGANGGSNNVATPKAKGNSDASSMQAMLEIRDSISTSRGPRIQSRKTHGLSKGEMRGVRRGIASKASMMMFGNDALELSKVRSCNHLPLTVCEMCIHFSAWQPGHFCGIRGRRKS